MPLSLLLNWKIVRKPNAVVDADDLKDYEQNWSCIIEASKNEYSCRLSGIVSF